MDALISESLSDYENWVNANSPNKFSLFDYLHGILKTKDIEPDLIVAFLKVFWPEFYCIDGFIFLKEEFQEGKYVDLVKQGTSEKDIEYWMNLVSVDGLFDSATFEQSKYIAHQMAEIWKSKLQSDFTDKEFIVECLTEEDEVYVVFHQDR
ncbi:MAG: hypothetical protein ABJ327_09095 [Litoreibacter sp.]